MIVHTSIIRNGRYGMEGNRYIFHFLSSEEFADVLLCNDSSSFCIGGIVDNEMESVTFYGISIKPITVPWSFFEPVTEVVPDFSKFGVIDYGRTVKFGEYEAAFAAVLEVYGD